MKLTSVKQMFLVACLFLATTLETQAEVRRVDEAYFSSTVRGEIGADDTVDTVANQYIVKFKPGGEAVMPVKEALMRLPSINALLLTGETPIDTDAVEYIEPNYVLKADLTPNDPDFSKLWGLESIGLIPTWDTINGSEILIAVIDSGIDYNHPDLAANMWTNPGEIPGNGIDDDGNGYIDDVYGFDFANGDGDPADDYFHGTHCAGTIAAVGNNGTGMVGVNWTAKLMALKFLDKSGFGDTAHAISAIHYAVQKGAKILSNSWGGSGEKALKDAIRQAQEEKGVLFVAAAGNSTANTDMFPHYPSSYDLDNIISVAAIDRNNALGTFSNYGPISVDLAAPGVDIYSTVPVSLGSYVSQEGTSMATPHVTGVAALVWAANPTFTYQQVKDRILSSVDPVPSLSGKTATGGKLNAYRAVIGDSKPPDELRRPPVASCSASGSGMTVTFDGSKSRDTNEGGYLTRYLWTFANQADTTPATGDKMTTEFQTPGTYVVTLTVTDNDNLTGEAKCNVTVPWQEEENYLGSPPLRADFNAEEGASVVGEVGTPPAEKCESGISKCTWTVCKQTPTGCNPDGTLYGECKFSQVFNSEGTYKITPMLTCNDGKTITKSDREVRVLPSIGGGFAGGISVNGDSYKTYVAQQLTDTVDVVGEIKPILAHVNQLVDIVVYALYPQYPTSETDTWFMLDRAGGVLVWDGNPANVVAFKPQVPLTSPHLVTMYKGQFVLPGHLLVYFGYRLPDGTLVNSNNPIDITINQ
ncbi:MAG: hypothetical protein BWK78_01255 [Thiotrichaceae bacterium IS1]|nr:MAG: hypothetical protein BWK78_01255 [Thiotrichaceae bacterium IS1]